MKMLLVSMSFIIFSCYSCFGILEEERSGLFALLASLNKDYPRYLQTNGTSDCCLWHGVKCNAISGRMVRLDLSYSRIPHFEENYYLNLSLFRPFEHLNSLYLSGNNIVGFVDDQDFKLKNLEILDLGDNKLNDTCTIGSIFSTLSSLSSLKSLNLNSNNLNFSKSNNFYNVSWLSKLESLDLSFNQNLGNDVLTFLGASDLSSLTSLDLSYTGLEGAIQLQDFNNLINLKELRLKENAIETFVPIKGVVRNLSDMETLDLSSNYLGGDTFTLLEANGFSSIKFLDVENNNIGGSINVEDLIALRNLEELNISRNHLNKFVEHEDGAGTKKWSKLQVLHMNQMSCTNSSILIRSMGPIFKSLKSLYLARYLNTTRVRAEDFNNWIGRNLEELFLDGSAVDNDFIREIGSTNNLTSLKLLSLSYCHLNDTLSTLQGGLCELKQLEELYLDGNEIQGILPLCMRNLTSLRVVEFSRNQLSGNVASSPLVDLTSLEYISISDNYELEVPSSFMFFRNHSKLKVIKSDNVQSVNDRWKGVGPKFQLTFFSMKNCTWKSHQSSNNGPPSFLHYQFDLRVVDLFFNNFRGSRFLSGLLENNTRLEDVDLAGNSFSGHVHLPSHSHHHLRFLDISINNITGHIPSNISLVLPKLEILGMEQNALEGQIPPRICDLKYLRVLALANNNLSGGIRGQFSIGCKSLQLLSLSNNHLSGQLFSRVPYELVDLYVDGNDMDGNIPRLFGGDLLRSIDLSINSLSGPIPKEICNFELLEDVYLAYNNLSGSLPPCLPRSIKRLHVNKNRIAGPLMFMEDAFKNSSGLVMLDLSDNNFRGSIPTWIANISSLRFLLLSANHFHGHIPIQLCSLKALTILDLSHNDFSGPILPCLGNISFQAADFNKEDSFWGFGVVLYFNAMTKSYSGFHAVYPSPSRRDKAEIRVKRNVLSYTSHILVSMSSLDLSGNQLTGQIPIEFGNLSELRSLNLSNNRLSGPIPVTFSGLSNIESLDISYNNLAGEIPPQLKELNFLGTFSVAYNNLSGAIPSGAQFATFDEASYEGNQFLCGPPLHKSCAKVCDDPDVRERQNEDEDDGALIDMEFFYVSFGVSYVAVLLVIAIVLWINPYWRRVWFFFIEECIYSSYYFVVDTFSKLFKSEHV